MKKSTFLFGLLLSATGAFAQTWQTNSYGLYLNQAAQNLGIGTEPNAYMKLRLQNSAAYNGALYGLYNSVTNSYSGSGSAYGIYSYSTTGTASTGSTYGLCANTYTGNSTSTATTYGLYSYASKNGTTTGTVYGVYSVVDGGAKRYAGYFSGGDVYMSGNVGIGTTTPISALDVAITVPDAIRIGKVGYTGNKNVPKGAVAMQFNIDFTGYRDISTDQIGARIAAFRLNDWEENNALIQITGLSFYTNPTGMNTGTTNLVERMRIMPNGNIGMGTNNPTVKLDVIGTIRAEEVKVCLTQGCDFVFDKEYKLMPLKDLGNFISTNKHLPEVAPAAEMENNGINLSEMNAKLLQKIEELTLYVIDLQNQINDLKK